MKVLFWGPNSAEIISKLEEYDGDLRYLSISNWEELKASLESAEMSIMIIDIDDKLDSIQQMANELKQQFSHCLLLLSFQSLDVKQLKQLQQTVPEVNGFLKRPHQPAKLLELIQGYASQLLTDHPANMKKGGTEDIDVGASLNSLNLRPAQEVAVEEKQADKTVMSEETNRPEELAISFSYDDLEETENSAEEKTSLDNINDEKEGFALNDSTHEGEIEVHSSTQVNPLANEQSSEGDPEEAERTLELKGQGSVDSSEKDSSDIPLPEVPDHLDLESSISQQVKNASGNVETSQGDRVLDTDIGQAPPPLMELAELKKESESISRHHSEELLHLKATIESLREDREMLIKKLDEQTKGANESKYRLNGLQAELDEAKIELIFLKKRSVKEVDNLRYTTQLAQQKKDILLEKNKQLRRDVERAKGQVQFDMQKVQEREKALESQLELLKVDSENLLKNRDQKILELKRKIDTLEFDLETVSEKEKRAKEDRYLLEDRLEKVMETLRRTIGNLDEDLLAEKSEDQDKKLTEL